MNLIVDIIIVTIMLLSIYFGYRKGLIGVVFSVISFIAAIIIASILFIPISSAVMEATNFDENIQVGIANNFIVTGETEQENTNIITEYINGQLSTSINNSIEGVSRSLAETIVKAIVFIVVFIAAKILLGAVKWLANLIAKIPVIKQVNGIGGILFGIIRGLLIIYIGFALLLLIYPLIADAGMYKQISNSYLGSLMYNNNIIMDIIIKN